VLGRSSRPQWRGKMGRVTSSWARKWRHPRHTPCAVPHPGRQRVLLHSVLRSGPPGPNRCLHRTGRSWQPESCSATLLVRQPRLTRRGSGVATSIAFSTWHWPPQIQRGHLCPDSIIARAAHPALCTLHQ
jgi:hypothetical protein